MAGDVFCVFLVFMHPSILSFSSLVSPVCLEPIRADFGREVGVHPESVASQSQVHWSLSLNRPVQVNQFPPLSAAHKITDHHAVNIMKLMHKNMNECASVLHIPGVINGSDVNVL